MNYSTYKQLFDEILENPHPAAPYDDATYLNYVRLNRSRMRRWDAQMALDKKLVTQLKQISQPQHWIIISEPWCGDAAHTVPFLVQMTEQNDLLTYEIQLRDSDPFLIEQYLTNGGKAIPKLIVRDDTGNDVFVWGPRAISAQRLANHLKSANASKLEILDSLQRWYNQDKGESLCLELSVFLKEKELA
ncbi:thioredoxin family protein [Pinibacter soli]|uniref:Thioredoxin family protein n=1 Tax=Pinibacter soli TaxID=3044211 RepID=A0ABT6REQ6_9BACT|nr:thioredoxin family protein [Pinibacter soli]MDI3320327.1 thioredoxin family protein [Pinibacter soli]